MRSKGRSRWGSSSSKRAWDAPEPPSWRSSWAWCASGSVRSRRSGWRSWCSACRRRALVRSSAARSRRLPMASSTACRPPSMIPRASRRSRPRSRRRGIRGAEKAAILGALPLGVTGNTPDSGSGESWFDPRRGNPSGRIRGRLVLPPTGWRREPPPFHIASPDLLSHRVTVPETKPDDSWAVDERSLKLFAAQLQGPPAERAWYDLRREAERIALVPGFDRLITLDANAIKELPHQIDVAQRVLRQMGGRAILADEVGLGKTIEASIIYKELAIRGLARRALILTPASLVGQWQGELEEKFFERFEAPTDPDDWQHVTKAIVSHDRARSRRHAEEILRHHWDLVIVDEAHKIKSHRGATYQFIEKIERDFILLLTATPLQNDLRELYNLITLLRPGQLGTWQEFKAEHLVSGDHRQPRDPAALRALTHEVMIRTRRSSVVDDLNLPPRRPRQPEVKLTRAEADLYERTTEFLRRLYREGFIQPVEQEEAEDGKRRRRPTKKGILQLALLHLRQRLCSSARALAESLQHLGDAARISPAYRAIARQLAQRAQRIKTPPKPDVLTKLLQETPDRVVVFSDHRPTLQLIEERVKQLVRKRIVY